MLYYNLVYNIYSTREIYEMNTVRIGVIGLGQRGYSIARDVQIGRAHV